MRIGLFLILFFQIATGEAEINPALIQKGIGTIIGVKNQVGAIRNKVNTCKFNTTDAMFVYGLMVEYNKEQLADLNVLWDDTDGAKLMEMEGGWQIEGCLDKCIAQVTGSPIKSASSIKNRAIAQAILNQMTAWSMTDYTKDELQRRNRVMTSACVGEAVKVLGGIKEQVLSPLLGTMISGGEGQAPDTSGGLGGILNVLGGQQ